MRVAHFVQRYPPALGGSEAYFARLGRFLAGCGDRVTVFTTNALALEAFWARAGDRLLPGTTWEDGVEVHRYSLWSWPGRRYLLKTLSRLPIRTWQCLTFPCNPIAWSMWRDAGRADERFDLVHATAFPYAWPIACGRRLARRLGVPFMVTPFLHLGNPDDPRDRTRRSYLHPALLDLLRSADGVFVQTDLERDALLRHGLAAPRLVLLGMGVDPEECTGGNRERVRREWGAGTGEVVIGHLANNSEEKGTVDLLRAAAQLWARGRHFRVVLAGPAMPNFLRFWDRFTPHEPIRRLGILDDREKRDFFAGIDVFALPSRSDSFGLVLLEAWANGVPNVAYRAGGIAEVIQHEKDGLLATCGDIEGLTMALQRLIESEALRRRLGQEGMARTRCEFRWEQKLERVRQVYESIAGSQGSLPGSPLRTYV
jgi:glycosyltransferase involved in cell wall biosynthesis